MNNVMLDLETMSTTSNAAIIAIGAVRFDSKVTDSFYMAVDLKSCCDIGLEMDASTVVWWMQQSQEARDKFKAEKVPINEALLQFSRWIGPGAIMWGDGAGFDNVILANAYRKAFLPQPWQFWNDRCYRTMKNLHPKIEKERIGVCHCAIDDAESQALHLIKILSLYEAD